MSIETLENIIKKFEINVLTLTDEIGILPHALQSFSELVTYFPQLKQTEEYKKLDQIFKFLQNPITRFFTYKTKSTEIVGYAGKLVAEANKELEKIKKAQRPLEVKPAEVKREIVAVEIPPSPWYKVANDADELSDAMWEDEFKIRNILPIFEKLISELENLGEIQKIFVKN
ncbi:MAG: hypothetical protein ACP5O8_02110 [Candidatus Aenigmatarchaeota archaeon]